MKKLIKLASSNGFLKLKTIFFHEDKAVAYSADEQAYAATTGKWWFDQPTLIQAGTIKRYLSIKEKNPLWVGDTLNGFALPRSSNQDISIFSTINFKEADFSKIEVDNFSEIIRKIKPAMAKDDVRPYVLGMMIDCKNNLIAATDGHRLHAYTGTINNDFETIKIIPRVVFDLCQPTELRVNNEYVAAIHSNGVIITKLIDSSHYPNVKKVMNLQPENTAFNFTQAQIENIRIAKILHSGKEHPGIKINKNGDLAVYCEDQVDALKLPCFDFEKNENLSEFYGVNPNYFYDAMRMVENGEIILSKLDRDKIIIKNDRFTAIVMPVSL
jgi:DNA polymerase III sliding clamp (beta) subunit (PCNA family)